VIVVIDISCAKAHGWIHGRSMVGGDIISCSTRIVGQWWWRISITSQECQIQTCATKIIVIYIVMVMVLVEIEILHLSFCF